MSHPRTAIIVLNYNGLNITKKFLKHLYSYTENFHLIIIDNGSKDGSVEYLGDFADNHDNVTLACNDSNLGVIGGRNHGFNIYKSLKNRPSYLSFLDNDQYVQEGWLQHHYDVLFQSKSDIVGVEAWLLSADFVPMHQCKRPNEPWTYVGCGGMLMSADIPLKIGMFDERFNPCYFEDPDFCFKAMEAGYKLSWNYRAKVLHLAHQTLGKNPRKLELFRRSLARFRKKWRGKKFRSMRQHPVTVLQ